MNNPHVRWMIRRDMPEVVAIEQARDPYPWCEEDLLKILRRKDCIGMVAEIDEAVAGFMMYRLKTHAISFLKFGVADGPDRATVEHALIAKVVSKLREGGRQRVTAILRESDLDGHLLLQREGFRAVQVDRGHFEDSGEDAYGFRFCLPVAAPADC